MSNKRPSWDDYFLKVLDAIAERSSCDRGKVGCVFVKGTQILSTGYAGAPPKLPHCDDVGHLMEERQLYIDQYTLKDKPEGYEVNLDKQRYEKPKSQHCIRTVHAEMNAILQAAKIGIALEGCTAYVSLTPCRNCAMFLISIGVKRIVCKGKYHAGKKSEEMFKMVGISIEFRDEKVVSY